MSSVGNRSYIEEIPKLTTEEINKFLDPTPTVLKNRHINNTTLTFNDQQHSISAGLILSDDSSSRNSDSVRIDGVILGEEVKKNITDPDNISHPSSNTSEETANHSISQSIPSLYEIRFLSMLLLN